MEAHDPRLRRVWKQSAVPVVYRRGSSKALLVRMPYSAANQEWLRAERRSIPKWNSTYKCWEIPRSWLDDVVKRLLVRFGKTYFVQPFRALQKCAPACWNASGVDCECSCMGANHGSGNPIGKWYVISDTCAVQWGNNEYSCRLLKGVPSNTSSSIP